MDKTVEFPAEHDGFTLVGCGIGVLFFLIFPPICWIVFENWWR